MSVKTLSAIFGIAVSLIVLPGCAGTPQGKDLGTGFNREWAGNLPLWRTTAPRSIAVIPEGGGSRFPELYSLPFSTESEMPISSEYETPTSERAARAVGGAAAGGLVIIGKGCLAGPVGCLAGVILAPVGIVVGAVAGATHDPDPTTPTGHQWLAHEISSLEGATELFKAKLIEPERDPENLISEKVAQEIRLLTRHEAMLLQTQNQIEAADQTITFHGFVEIKVEDFGLFIEGSPDENSDDPPVALTTSVRVNIYSISRKTYIFFERALPRFSLELSGRWTYLGEFHKYSELSADDGHLLVEELTKMTTNTAIHIVRDIF